VDLREYSMEDLHSQIGVIFQDFMRYEMTARENIAVGRIELAQDGAVYEAAQKSLADEVIGNYQKVTSNCLDCASREVWTSPAASGRRSRWHAPIFATPNW
jgi:ABC-type multidrug transport system fused ATPase/permease subunit